MADAQERRTSVPHPLMEPSTFPMYGGVPQEEWSVSGYTTDGNASISTGWFPTREKALASRELPRNARASNGEPYTVWRLARRIPQWSMTYETVEDSRG